METHEFTAEVHAWTWWMGRRVWSIYSDDNVFEMVTSELSSLGYSARMQVMLIRWSGEWKISFFVSIGYEDDECLWSGPVCDTLAEAIEMLQTSQRSGAKRVRQRTSFLDSLPTGPIKRQPCAVGGQSPPVTPGAPRSQEADEAHEPRKQNESNMTAAKDSTPSESSQLAPARTRAERRERRRKSHAKVLNEAITRVNAALDRSDDLVVRVYLQGALVGLQLKTIQRHFSPDFIIEQHSQPERNGDTSWLLLVREVQE